MNKSLDIYNVATQEFIECFLFNIPECLLADKYAWCLSNLFFAYFRVQLQCEFRTGSVMFPTSFDWFCVLIPFCLIVPTLVQADGRRQDGRVICMEDNVGSSLGEINH